MGNKANEKISNRFLQSQDRELRSNINSEIPKKIEDKNDKEQLDLESYIKDPNLINYNNIKKIINLIQSEGTSYKSPFLNIYTYHNLIKVYIESELDEKEDENYYEVFEELKKKCFINMNCLNPIYEYFSDILYNIKNIKDNDKKFLKFPKVHRLWKIFYDDNLKKNVDKDAQISSICFNGGYLKLVPLYEELKDKFETHKKDKNFNLTFEMYSIKGNINEFSNLISVELKEKKI